MILAWTAKTPTQCVVAVFAATVCATLPGCAHHTVQPSVAHAGGPAMNFVAHDVEGHVVELSDYIGHSAVLLDFCSTWCEPCVSELPHLRQVYEKGKTRGLVVLAIALEAGEDRAKVPLWARRHEVPFPVIFDEGGSIASFYNPRSLLPLKVLIDSEGYVTYIHYGYTLGDEQALDDAIAKAVARRG